MVELVLAIDVGTNSLKAGVFDPGSASWVAAASRPLSTRFGEGGVAEQDDEDYWAAACDVVAELRRQVGERMRGVRAISTTGQMRTFVPVGAHHRAIGPALTLYDRRATHEYEQFISQFGLEEIYRITGQRFDPASTPAKLRWARENSSLSNAWKILAPKDYLKLRLTGEATTDPIDASGWLLYDLGAGKWHEELASFAQIRVDQLPEILPASASVGVLLPEVASSWGVSSDAIVAVGGGDDIAATGAGAIGIGDVYEHIGSTGSIFCASDRPHLDPQCIVECYPTEQIGRYWVGGSCNSAGTAINHALSSSSFCHGKIDWNAVSSALELWEPRARVDAPMYLPFVTGERCPIWNAHLRAAWRGIDVADDAIDWAIAVHEGPALVLTWILSELRRTGLQPRRLFSAGKAGEHHAYAHLRATLYECPVHRNPQPDAALFAAALIGMVALNPKREMADLVREFAGEVSIAHPREELVACGRERLRMFQREAGRLTSQVRAAGSS